MTKERRAATSCGRILANCVTTTLRMLSGALQKILELAPEPGAQLGDMVRAITECYPKEIIDYYSPTYSKQLLDQLDAQELNQ